jgi:hypothetical protein
MDGGLFKKLNFSPSARRALFWGVCIFVRLGLAVLASYLSLWWPVPTAWVVLILAAVAAAFNAWSAWNASSTSVWWSRPMHMILALAIVGAAILVLTKQLDPKMLGVVVGLDVVFGVAFAIISQNPQ